MLPLSVTCPTDGDAAGVAFALDEPAAPLAGAAPDAFAFWEGGDVIAAALGVGSVARAGGCADGVET